MSQRPSKAEQLQELWDSAGVLFEGIIEFRPFKGWYAQPIETRHFNDEGDFLGPSFKYAHPNVLSIVEWAKGNR